MTAPTFAVEAPTVADSAPDVESLAESTPTPDAQAATAEAKAPAKKTTGKKAKTFELTLTVTGTADGEWRAAKELHEELFTPIEALMDEARSQQAARVAALEAELDAARKALADLD